MYWRFSIAARRTPARKHVGTMRPGSCTRNCFDERLQEWLTEIRDEAFVDQRLDFGDEDEADQEAAAEAPASN